VLVESAGIPKNINLALQLRSAPEPKQVSQFAYLLEHQEDITVFSL